MEKIQRLDEFSKKLGTSHRPVRLSLQFDDSGTINAFCYGRFICASVNNFSFITLFSYYSLTNSYILIFYYHIFSITYCL